MQNVSKLVEFLVVAQHGQFFRENICAYLQSHSQDRTCTKNAHNKIPCYSSPNMLAALFSLSFICFCPTTSIFQTPELCVYRQQWCERVIVTITCAAA